MQNARTQRLMRFLGRALINTPYTGMVRTTTDLNMIRAVNAQFGHVAVACALKVRRYYYDLRMSLEQNNQDIIRMANACLADGFFGYRELLEYLIKTGAGEDVIKSVFGEEGLAAVLTGDIMLPDVLTGLGPFDNDVFPVGRTDIYVTQGLTEPSGTVQEKDKIAQALATRGYATKPGRGRRALQVMTDPAEKLKDGMDGIALIIKTGETVVPESGGRFDIELVPLGDDRQIAIITKAEAVEIKHVQVLDI